MPVNRKYAVFIIKLLIAGFSIAFIYLKVISRSDFGEMVENLKSSINNSSNIPVAVLILLLMGVNWLLESAKWKVLLDKIVKSSWLLSLRSVLTGVTVSLFTPNRVGEFAGRVMHLNPDLRIKSSIACVIGSTNQLLVTVLAGLAGFYCSSSQLMSNLPELKMFLQFVSPVLFIFILLLYFNLKKLQSFILRFNFLKKWSKYTEVMRLYSFTDLLKVSCLSLIRYIVFSYQFILMMQLFGVTIDFLEGLRVISLIYFVMTMIPSIAISELTVRGSVALYFLAPYTSNSAGVLAATTLVWFVNLVVPAIIGALMIFYIKLNLKRFK